MSTKQRGTRRTGLQIAIALVVLSLFVGVAAAQGGENTEELRNQMENIGNFLTIVIIAVAAPNAAYGLFEYMTAGTDAEATQKGKKRIRNSFIAAGGAAVIQVAVRALSEFITVGGG